MFSLRHRQAFLFLQALLALTTGLLMAFLWNWWSLQDTIGESVSLWIFSPRGGELRRVDHPGSPIKFPHRSLVVRELVSGGPPKKFWVLGHRRSGAASQVNSLPPLPPTHTHTLPPPHSPSLTAEAAKCPTLSQKKDPGPPIPHEDHREPPPRPHQKRPRQVELGACVSC